VDLIQLELHTSPLLQMKDDQDIMKFQKFFEYVTSFLYCGLSTLASSTVTTSRTRISSLLHEGVFSKIYNAALPFHKYMIVVFAGTCFCKRGSDSGTIHTTRAK
jgi:hypothetical protein